MRFITEHACTRPWLILPCFIFNVCIKAYSAPNIVRIKTVPAEGETIVTSAYTDGLGRSRQSHVHTESTTDLITVTTYDDVGRVQKSTKPFPVTRSGDAHTYLDMSDEELLYQASAAYGNDIAYSQIEYDNPFDRIKRAGAPGSVFSLEGGHALEKHYWCITDETDLATYADYATKGNVTGGRYLLSVVKDPDGKISQIVSDILGNTIKIWSALENGGTPIVARYEHDILGNVLREIPPHPTDAGEAAAEELYSTSTYNTAGLLTQRKTPNAGTVTYTYYDNGALWRIEKASHIDDEEYIEISYDSFNRIENISEKLNDNAQPYLRVRSYYDTSLTLSQGEDFPQKEYICGRIAFAQGRLVAEVVYGDAPNERVLDIYSYDKRGRIVTKFKIIADLSPKKTVFEYDRLGKLVREEFFDQCDQTTGGKVKNYIYDHLGRLRYVRTGEGTKMIEYVYNDKGQLSSKMFFNPHDESFSEEVVYTYTIRDWVQQIGLARQENIFREDVRYHDPNYGSFGGYFGGDIAQTDILLNGDVTKIAFEYDDIKRLVTAQATNTAYGGSYSYDNLGRMKKKNEAGRNFDPYEYYTGTSRLKRIPYSEKAGLDGVNYIYDADGNMIFDRSKNMLVEYDWRDMPKKFKFYEALPGNITTAAHVAAITSTPFSEVSMLYDAGGSRVMKRAKRKTDFQ